MSGRRGLRVDDGALRPRATNTWQVLNDHPVASLRRHTHPADAPEQDRISLIPGFLDSDNRVGERMRRRGPVEGEDPGVTI